ncbi:MAG TPA: FMN-binding protein [Lachnospiraceae bacterium]|nr:FMN-binding protein [Lachnospiraceae bacterium]
MKKKLKVFGIIVAILVIGIGVIIFVMGKKMDKQVNALEYPEIDMQKVNDGTYTGETETDLVKASVQVTVKDHAITDVKILKHDCGKGKPAEVIVKNMVEENSYQVDTVSGATLSSKVIMNAVSKALMKGIDE